MGASFIPHVGHTRSPCQTYQIPPTDIPDPLVGHTRSPHGTDRIPPSVGQIRSPNLSDRSDPSLCRTYQIPPSDIPDQIPPSVGHIRFLHLTYQIRSLHLTYQIRTYQIRSLHLTYQIPSSDIPDPSVGRIRSPFDDLDFFRADIGDLYMICATDYVASFVLSRIGRRFKMSI